VTDNRSDTATSRYDMQKGFSESVYIDNIVEIPKGEFWSDWALYIFRDAVVNWVYSKRFNYWSLRIIYWKQKVSERLREMKCCFRRVVYFSGFCSRNRGRHWDRKRR